MQNSFSQSSNKALVRLVDDEKDILESLSYLLQSEGIDAECFSSAKEFLSQFSPQVPGCIVLDYLMPEMDGMMLQKELNNLECPIPVIFLTAHADVDMAIDVFRNGATDILRKPIHPEEFIEKVKTAIASDLTARRNSEQKNQELMGLLTNREKQILNLAKEGLSNALIAERLALSERTVEVHRGNAYHKIRVRNLAELREFLDNQSL